jgi:hypothetical protein
MAGLLPLIVQTVSHFASNLELMEMEGMEELTIELLSLIILATEHQKFYETFRLLTPQVVVTIIMNFLKTTDDEFQFIESEP